MLKPGAVVILVRCMAVDAISRLTVSSKASLGFPLGCIVYPSISVKRSVSWSLFLLFMVDNNIVFASVYVYGFLAVSLLQGSPKSPKSGEGGFPAVDSAGGAIVASAPSVDAPPAPAVGNFSADVSVPEVPAVPSDLAGKLPSSAAEMSAAGDVAVEVPGVSVPEASATVSAGEMEMPGPLPAAGDISVGEFGRK